MLTKLPDAEFEVMKAVWVIAAPMNVNAVAKKMDKNWKIQTLISLMLRLVERGFMRTEKIGRERVYFPLVSREEYLEFETCNFVSQYHERSFLSLITALHGNIKLTDEDIDGLRRLVAELSCDNNPQSAVLPERGKD